MSTLIVKKSALCERFSATRQLTNAQTSRTIGFVEKERRTVRVVISPAAKEVVENYAEKEDMTETGVLSRIYERFGTLPEVFQDWMLFKIRPELHAQAVRAMIEYLQEQAPASDLPLDEDKDEADREKAKLSQRRQRTARGGAAAGSK